MRTDVPIDEALRRHRNRILELAATHGARNVRVFGSAARGEARPDSDLDLPVEFEPGRTLLDRVALKQDLEDLLRTPVDVATPTGLHWYIRDRVLSEAVLL